MSYIFPKSQRLNSQKVIDGLYKKGSKNTESIFCYPFRVVYAPVFVADQKSKVLFSVPKRSFKKAVDRNTIKRRLKEAFRLQQHLLLAGLPEGICIAYIAKEILEYSYLEHKLQTLFQKLNEIQTGQKNTVE
jgi:ribonuclease P protein component